LRFEILVLACFGLWVFNGFYRENTGCVVSLGFGKKRITRLPSLFFFELFFDLIIHILFFNRVD
jgi:hypothetical protein